MKTTSASLSTAAALGGGSKVWELVPSGTSPVTVAASPATAETIEVIGATVVTRSAGRRPRGRPRWTTAEAARPGRCGEGGHEGQSWSTHGTGR